jgi:tRNA A37 N6-isopentenylltransferase MiaA
MARFLKHGLITAICGIFFLLGILFADLGLHLQLSDSVASLLGAALGSAITIAGSFWLIKATATHRADGFKQLFRDNITFLRQRAQTTRASLQQEAAKNFEGVSHDSLAGEVKTAHEKLLASAALFAQLPFEEIVEYEARIALQSLHHTLTEERQFLEREIRFLGDHPTINVLRVAANNFESGAERIVKAADQALAKL